VFDPAARYGGGAANSTLADTASETTSEMASGSSMTGTLLNAPRSGRSLLANLQLGRELTSLASVIRTDAFAAPELTPGLFLVDLDDRSYVNLNGNQRFAAASMIKVPVLVAFFQDVDAGKIQLNDVFTMQEEDVASGSGDMQFHDVGTEYSAIEVATLMITISDNTATNILIREMGGIEALNRRFQSWGFAETRLNSVLPDLEGTNTTTPQELVELMVLVSQGELISLRSRDRLLEIMRGTVTNTLLPAGIAPEATIAHKTGDIGSLVGDVGVVDMPNGKRYAIAAMVQRPHNDDRAQELIRQMSRTVYDYLENPRQFQLSNSDSSSQLNSVTDDLDPEINPESSYEDGL
jgi:beta-lactamase class A